MPTARAIALRAACAACAVAVLTACGGDGTPAPAIRLELPTRTSDRSLLLAVETENAARGKQTELEALAIDPQSRAAPPFLHPLGEGDTVTVTALLYEAPLDALFL